MTTPWSMEHLHFILWNKNLIINLIKYIKYINKIYKIMYILSYILLNIFFDIYDKPHVFSSFLIRKQHCFKNILKIKN